MKKLAMTVTTAVVATGVMAAGGFPEFRKFQELTHQHTLAIEDLADKIIAGEEDGFGTSLQLEDSLHFQDSYSMDGVHAGGQKVALLY